MSSQSSRRGSRGGGGGGRYNSSGGRSSRGGGAGGGRRGGSSHHRRLARQRSRSDSDSNNAVAVMRDEEILIAFMPYLKGDNAEAAKIHEDYQAANDQKLFLRAARDFLMREQQQQQQSAAPQPASASAPPVPTSQNAVIGPPSIQRAAPPIDSVSTFVEASSLPQSTTPAVSGSPLLPPRPDPPGAPPQERSPALPSAPEGLNNMREVGNGLDELLLKDDPIFALPGRSSLIWAAANRSTGHTAPRQPITPPRSSTQTSPWNTPSPLNLPPPSSSSQTTSSTTPTRELLSTSNNETVPFLKPTKETTTAQSTAIPDTEAQQPPSPPPPRPARKEPHPAKRVWAHFEEQPGRIIVNGCTGEDPCLILPLGPREELTAHWSLPLDYLRRFRPDRTSLNDALEGLTVGLFRRGCTENGSQASIISKLVLGDNNRCYDYGVDKATNSVRGRVPFYSPRTPGHVLFRLYWEHAPLYTLAMGPTLHVRVTERDFDSSVRFILSNFKGKKSNTTSLSSLHSLAQVLETRLTRPNESAARATWGCIQESRKVVHACAQEYARTSSKLAQLEETVEELKKQVEEDNDARSQALSSMETDDEEGVVEEGPVSSEASSLLRDKTRELLSGRASCERKWRDSQLAFAGILKAVVSNPSMNILLRHELISKMRLEFELWCPLSEEFAIPMSETAIMWYDHLQGCSHVAADDFQMYAQARSKMQMRTLGFEPNTLSLDDVLFPRNRGMPNQRTMDPGAVAVFNTMSAAMGQYYQELFADEDRVVRQRELIRDRTEKCVQECGVFPPGTSVVIFGSSANGFGSPKSDLDMCLQLPHGTKLAEEDKTGSEAMAKLAEHFEKSGMQQVDTARLSARIPIIMYRCPDPLASTEEEVVIECDLSMHNPLAVLNTTLLRTYAEITPVTRVLASVIKRWAKARDINNPARHTLSSYGYIIMLLHFLTYHERAGNGLMSPVALPGGDRRQSGPLATPLLPNLQWMDPMWPNFPRGTPYRELATLPNEMMPHPREEKKTVNSHFYKPKTPNETAVLQMLFPGQDLSLAILLASFFRYYAYEFDYKRYVVSLHSTATRGIVEREMKAELDGWRHYSAALTIEDPFETFYDIAHVLRGGYYHRIRREFAVAYSKIADAASGRPGSWGKGNLRNMSGKELVDWICEPLEKDPEQT